MANEKRLIDANAADVERIPCYYGDQCHTEDVQEWLNEQPTVDAVEVVRCKDCKYYWLPQGFCTHDRHDHQTMAVWQEDDDFCSYGERREGE